jgi:hypothetical protein
VAHVLEPVALGASWRQRQNRVPAIECLNRGLFIDAEHGRMLRGSKYKPMIFAALCSKSGSLDRR